MDYDSALPRRRSPRLQGYDYAKAGAYFVTVATENRLCLFGEVDGGEMRLNETGRLVDEAWQWLETRYPLVALDEYVVMPNHLHGVLAITDEGGRKDLGSLIGAFKTVAAKRVNLARGAPGRRLWQRNFHDRVVRSEEDLDRVRAYIRDNPHRWELDAENPLRPPPARAHRAGP